jgi:hypothetical protein
LNNPEFGVEGEKGMRLAKEEVGRGRDVDGYGTVTPVVVVVMAAMNMGRVGELEELGNFKMQDGAMMEE